MSGENSPYTDHLNNDILSTFFYRKVLSKETCEKILLEADWDPERTKTYLELQANYIPGFKRYQPDTIQALAQTPGNLWIRQRFHQLLSRLNDNHYHFEATHLSEIQLLTLKKGDEIDWFSNIGLGPFALRKVCLFAILSDDSDYDGGQIYPLTKATLQTPAQGNVVVAPSVATLCIRPIKQGELKLLFTTLDGDQPFR